MRPLPPDIVQPAERQDLPDPRMIKYKELVRAYESAYGGKRHTCDQLGLCHHTDLDCNEHTCHKALMDDGHVDIPLPSTGGGNFWLDPTEDPNGVTPGSQQPHLTNVKSRPPSVGDFVYYWTPVFMVYLFCVALGGYIYARFFG